MAISEMRSRPKAVATSVAPDTVTTLSVGPDPIKNYLRLVTGGGEGGPLIKCMPGSLILVSPSVDHERPGRRLYLLIAVNCTALKIPFEAAGSTLYPVPGTDHGYQPDDSFYLGERTALADRAGKPGGAMPDLVVEVVNTYSAEAALDACPRMGVKELWVFDVQTGDLTIRQRVGSGPNAGALVVRTASRVFPTLTAAEVKELLALPATAPRSTGPYAAGSSEC
jgi:Uma2 family endonuclease